MSSRPRPAVVTAATVTALALVSLASRPALAQTSYVGPPAGDWSVNGHWSTGVFPNAAGVDAAVAGDFDVTVGPGVTRSVRDLAVSSDATVTLLNNTFLQINGGLANDGTVTVDSGANVSRLRFFGTNNVTGTGAIRLTNGLIDGTGVVRFEGGVVSGSGDVGGNVLSVVNRATILGQNGVLTLDPRNTGTTPAFVNTGLVRSGADATVRLTGFGGGTFTNLDPDTTAVGVMEARGNNSVLELTGGASVVGGTLRGVNGGVVRTAAGVDVFVRDLRLEGTHAVDNNSDYGTSGTITLAPDATLTLTSGANATDLELQTDTTLAGSGRLVLAGPLAGVNGTGTLTVDAGVTVGGQGRFGQNTISVTNNGFVIADVAGGELVLDPRNLGTPPSFVNNNTLRATNGGILVLDGLGAGTFANAGGVIEAIGTGSTVNLRNTARLAGGTVRTTGGGRVTVGAGQNVFVSGLTLDATIDVGENTDFGVSGNIVNTGSITLAGVTNPTDLELQADTTLSGTGQIVMAAALSGVNGTGTLTNAAGHTIRGRGRLGQNTLSVTNNGTVLADVAGGELVLDPRNTGTRPAFVNTNVVRATNGGILVLDGLGAGTFANAGGVIEAAGAGSRVTLRNGADLAGGTLRGVTGGRVVAEAGQNVFLRDVVLAGVVDVENNTGFGTRGLITNNATTTLISTANATDLELRADTTLAGGGQLVMSGGLAGVNGTGTLINDSGHTIRGRGRLGQNTISITNNGFVIADVAGHELVLDPRNLGTPPSFVNNGTLRADAGGILVFDGFGAGSFLNNNTVEVRNGGQLRFRNGAVLQNAATAASNAIVGGTFRVFDDGTGTAFDIVPPAFDLERNGAIIEIRGPLVSSNLFDDATSTPGHLRGRLFRENTGRFVIGGGTNLTIDVASPAAVPFVNTGELFVDNGSVVRLLRGIGGGTPTGNVVRTTGTLGGDGRLEAGVVDASGGTVAVGNSLTPRVPSRLVLDAGLVLDAQSRVAVTLGGTSAGSFDVLEVTGDVTTSGAARVRVDLAAGYLPQPGQRFGVIEGGVSGGSFVAENGTGLAGLGVSTSVLAGAVEVLVTNLLPADFNYSGSVTISDFALLRSNFGLTNALFTQGDANQDGRINISDFAILRSSFGLSVTPAQLAEIDAFGLSIGYVPEPASLAVVTLGSLLLRRRR